MEPIFEIRDAEGGYHARALGQSVFTQADTWDDLRANFIEAVSLHFEDVETPANFRVARHSSGIGRYKTT